MRIRELLPALGAGALVLGACSTTSVTSQPVDSEAPNTLAATSSTVAPTTTLAPTTTVEPTTTTSTSTTSTTSTTTTTTLPAKFIAVPEMEPPVVAVGTKSGSETARAQFRLLELGFWVSDADGSYGLTTRQAVMAFQKYYGLTADGSLGEETADEDVERHRTCLRPLRCRHAHRDRQAASRSCSS